MGGVQRLLFMSIYICHSEVSIAGKQKPITVICNGQIVFSLNKSTTMSRFLSTKYEQKLILNYNKDLTY